MWVVLSWWAVGVMQELRVLWDCDPTLLESLGILCLRASEGEGDCGGRTAV